MHSKQYCLSQCFSFKWFYKLIAYNRYSHVIPSPVLFSIYSAGTSRGWGGLYLTSTTTSCSLSFSTSYLCKAAVRHGVNGKVAQQGNSGKAKRQQQNKYRDRSEELPHSWAGLSVTLLLRTMYLSTNRSIGVLFCCIDSIQLLGGAVGHHKAEGSNS